MTWPQWPQIKSSPPVSDILRSVLRTERFSVLTGPTGIMNIVAILSPKTLSPKTDYALELLTQGPSKSETDQPDTLACHIFAPAERGTTW
jgi:hypothetical protein